jgi:3-deoxy-D-manno-octulosonic-acid transferase
LATISADIDVIVLDSIGELLGFYKISDYAFVGGSLVPIGGHNVLEPILMQVPVFCGPFMQNSKAICDQLQASSAITIAKDINNLIASIIAMATDVTLRQTQISNATQVLEKNRGCLERYYAKAMQAIS